MRHGQSSESVVAMAIVLTKEPETIVVTIRWVYDKLANPK